MISKILWAILFTLLTICYAEIELEFKTDETGKETVDGIVITLKSRFHLICKETSKNESAALEVEWFLDNKPIVEGKRIHIHDHNNTLVINETRVSDCGLYMCRAITSDDKEANITVLVQSLPFITPSFIVSSMNKIEGEKLNLNCTAEGMPLPELRWLRDGIHISELNHSRFIIEGNHTSSVLKVDELEQSDKGNYSCVANNTVGSFKKTIYVDVKDKLAALWPFLGIVAEVTILCIIIFIYEKRRAKHEYDEAEADQNPETKSMNEKDNVRQRK